MIIYDCKNRPLTSEVNLTSEVKLKTLSSYNSITVVDIDIILFCQVLWSNVQLFAKWPLTFKIKSRPPRSNFDLKRSKLKPSIFTLNQLIHNIFTKLLQQRSLIICYFSNNLWPPGSNFTLECKMGIWTPNIFLLHGINISKTYKIIKKLVSLVIQCSAPMADLLALFF